MTKTMEMGPRTYMGAITLPTLAVATVGLVFAGVQIIEFGGDVFEGDWEGAGGNFFEAYVAAFVSAAVGMSAVDAHSAKTNKN